MRSQNFSTAKILKKAGLIRLFFTLPAALLLLVYLACSSDVIQTAGTPTINETSGCIVDRTGAPARGAQVAMYPSDYTAATDSKLSKIEAAGNSRIYDTITNDSGIYKFSANELGYFTIIAQTADTSLIVKIDSVQTTADGTPSYNPPPAMLKPPATIIGEIDWIDSTMEVYVLVVGSDRYVKVNPDGSFTIDKLPEGNQSLRFVTLRNGLPVDTVKISLSVESEEAATILVNDSGKVSRQLTFNEMMPCTLSIAQFNAEVPVGKQCIWYRDSIAFDTTVSGILILDSITPAQAGTYTCTIEGKSARYEFVVKVRPLISVGLSGGSTNDVVRLFPGARISLSAASDKLDSTGYTLIGWNTSPDGKGVGYTPDDTVVVDTANVILYAVWKKNVYSVQVIGDSGVVQTIAALYGEPQQITAQHPPHYHFVKWSLVSGSAVISDSLAVQTSVVPGNSNVTIKAIFVPDTYQLKIIDSTNGHGTGTGSITYGVSDTISAMPDTGYVFDKWIIVSGSATIADSAAPVTTILLDSASVIRPLFKLITFPVQLDKSSTHGSITGGTDTASVFTASYGTPVAIVASADTVNGYRFVKWIYLSGSAQFADSLSASTTVKITSPGTVITAQFALNEFTVQKSISGKGIVSIPDSVVHGTLVQIAATPSTGYHFALWRAVSGEVLFADSTASLTTMRVVKGSAVVLAVFAKNVYTLSYNGNSATGGTLPQVKQFSIGDTLIPGTAGTLTRSGYTFTGWNSTADGTGRGYHTGDTVIIADTVNLVLYAQWTVNTYSVVFDRNAVTATGTMSPQSFTFGTSANLTTNVFTRTGYSFAGWSTSAGGDIVYANGVRYTMATEGDTLYAKWILNPYTITFDKNDASATGTMSTQSIPFGDSAVLTVNGFLKTGYSFAGWATSSSGSVVYANGARYSMFTEGDTLYAKWTQNPYTITFDKNDPTATGTMSAQSITFGDSAVLTVNSFLKTGYSFAGWATSSGGSVVYANGARYSMFTEGDTLFAKWTQNSYNVTFNKNDPTATGTMSAQSITFGDSAVLTVNGFLKTGYSFAGWATSSSGSVVYANGARYSMFTEGDTLFAKWTQYPYTITFDKNDPSATGTMSLQSITFGDSAVLTANGFLKTGYSFAGWATSSSGSVVFANGARYSMLTEGDTLFAKWTQNLYTITFDKNDPSATGSMSAQSIAFGDSAVLTVNGFLRTGYSFAGWATNSSGSVVYANGARYSMFTEGDTLFAQWNKSDTFYILQDALIASREPNTTKNTVQYTAGYAWTWNDVPGTLRGLMQFDLSAIPGNSVIESAELYLYHYDHPTEVHEYLDGKTNISYLQRITSQWDATTVTWNNQPSVTSTNQATLPASQNKTQDYIVDVTALVQDMIDSNNFGLMLRLQTEVAYARLVFSSSKIANKSFVPKLVVRIRN